MPARARLAQRWKTHDQEWRDPAQVISQWPGASAVKPESLRHRTSGRWWETLAEHRVTLLVTREYEHLVLALRCENGRPQVSFLPLPHPSGLVVDRDRGLVHIASTRNPNQVFDLSPVVGFLDRAEVIGQTDGSAAGRLVPIRSRFYPGALYLHDLALVAGRLHGNAVGQNAVVELEPDGRYRTVWWPHCIETDTGPAFSRNYLQMNSIAAGPDLRRSFFSASTDRISSRRPNHKNFPVDRRGVIFSGQNGEVVARGLTRPHSARLHRGQLWVDNSGYGEVGPIVDGRFLAVTRLPGWTRGLSFHDGVAFVGSSRVIPRFRQYAPGLDVDRSVCAIHAVEIESGNVLGCLSWPLGNQLFAIEWLPNSFGAGLPYSAGRRNPERERRLFYAFRT